MMELELWLKKLWKRGQILCAHMRIFAVPVSIYLMLREELLLGYIDNNYQAGHIE